MISIENLPKRIHCLYPPSIFTIQDQTFASLGGQWYVIDESVTLDKLRARWVQPKVVKKVVQDTDDDSVKVEVKSSTGKGTYTVEYKYERWTCTCPSFGFRRKCKHIDQVKSKK